MSMLSLLCRGLHTCSPYRLLQCCTGCCCSPIRAAMLHCLQQEQRKVLRVKGVGASEFLQGLITNDMQHLQEGAPSMYAMVLNPQGRVLHDIVLYSALNGKEAEEYLLEVEAKGAEKLERHLKMYRLRKKIDIDIYPEVGCWVLFDPDIDFDAITKADMEDLYSNPKIDSKHELNISNQLDGMIITRDPRLKYLGHKLVLPADSTPQDLIPNLTTSSLSAYTNLRYRLGVAEGSSELPAGDVTPLEANVDYLHGISFHKGCYIGQELTARVHHTGVVRKRYMPIVFSSVPTSAVAPESKVVVVGQDGSKGGRSVGRVRAVAEQHGLALLRVADCLAVGAGQLVLQGDDVRLETYRPSWWPVEAGRQSHMAGVDEK